MYNYFMATPLLEHMHMDLLVRTPWGLETSSCRDNISQQSITRIQPFFPQDLQEYLGWVSR